MIDPLDPALDAACAACRHGLHGACMGWWFWCPCSCGLTDDDPRTDPTAGLNGHKETP